MLYITLKYIILIRLVNFYHPLIKYEAKYEILMSSSQPQKGKGGWISYRPSLPEQQTVAQHSKQPKHARAVQSCVNTIAHWLFIWEQNWMPHMQQQWLHKLAQQFEVALMNISAASGNFGSSDPGGILSAVAIKLPKPMQRFPRIIIFWPLGSTVFWEWFKMIRKQSISYYINRQIHKIRQ